MSDIVLRVGLPKPNGSIAREAKRRGYATLISAGALWNLNSQSFQSPGHLLMRMPSIALDSAGFVRGLSGYPWTVAQYVDFAVTWYFFDWWSQMDLPCEEALAPDRGAVVERVKMSAQLFAECLAESRRYRGIGTCYHKDPTPVLQGRLPEDYERSAELLAKLCGGNLPPLVGVGSMCTREVGGQDGVLAIMEALHKFLPADVRLHLFGVKGPALRHLGGFGDRVESVDSMGWDFGARKEAFRERRPNTVAGRIGAMVGWVDAQQSLLDT